MRIKMLAFGVCLALVVVGASATNSTWPKLIGRVTSPECKFAYRLAKSAYESSKFFLWEPQAVPDNANYVQVLGPQGLDLSGGDALDVDLSVFTKIPLPEYPQRSVYWQTKSSQGDRIVVREIPHGWRGDAYGVHSVPATLSVAEYFSATNSVGQSNLPMYFDGAWRAPLIFQHKQNGKLWFVYVGEPYVFSPSWSVYLPEGLKYAVACDIRFRPNVSQVKTILPLALKRFATLLDQTIGPGLNEGTLQPTARIRIDVQQAWANAVMRPWAVGSPYNSRKEVDDALLTWSEIGPSYKALYSEVLNQYENAEKALTSHYRKQFHMSNAVAKARAQSTLDTVFRMHYVFPKQR